MGAKLSIALSMDRHDTVGIDCVALCVNDIICSGASPLFFLNHVTCGENIPKEKIVSGIAEGCRQAGCALIGGDATEQPGFYPEEAYDLTGFCVGMVDRGNMLDGQNIVEGDVLIGLASNGLHASGYSLVQKVLDVEHADLTSNVPELGCSLGTELLRPTRIYARPVKCLMGTGLKVKAMRHITAGGICENVPKMLPEHICGEINISSIPVPPIFTMIQDMGHISDRDMYHTFNMGVGLVMAVAKEDAATAMETLIRCGERPYIIGKCVSGEKGVELW